MSSYKKFVAGAATATLVASAIAPVAAAADSKNFTDVNDRYKDAVDYVVSKGVNGLSDTQFGVQQNIKRVDAAVFIAKALELDG
ncbi:MAG TPA: bifunctional metallophosphatase/5'-nucleotidase, partial [Savagea sp.]